MGLLCDPEVEVVYRVVMAEGVNHPRIAELFFETVPLATKAAVSAALSGLLSRGELRLHNPDHASWRLFNLCLGGMHARLLCGLIRDLPQVELETQLKHPDSAALLEGCVDRGDDRGRLRAQVLAQLVEPPCRPWGLGQLDLEEESALAALQYQVHLLRLASKGASSRTI